MPGPYARMKLDSTILHLEDDDNDSFFFQRALDQLKFSGVYRRTSSVQETIDYFNGAKAFSDRKAYPLPDVLVADSTFGSGLTNTDLMGWLKIRAEFDQLVKIILTGDMSRYEQEKWIG